MIEINGIEFNCKRHPDYKVKRYPFSGCDACRFMWRFGQKSTLPLKHPLNIYEKLEISVVKAGD